MLNHIGTSAIETKRVLLRRFTLNDVQDMYENWASSENVTKYLTWSKHRNTNRTTMVISMWQSSYDNDEYYNWAIVDKDTNKVIGSINLMNIDNYNENCEVGYCLSSDFWNKGIMTEILLEVIKFAFNKIGFERITGRHHIDNVASGRVMEKCSFIYEGTLRKIIKNNNGVLVDCKYYSILKSEYKELL